MKEKGWIQINTIEGYNDVRDWYWLSNTDEDKIINRSTGKIMKIRTNNYGYKSIKLRTIEGKQKVCRIHIIKAKAFIFGPNPSGANIVRHLDDCKVNNRLENLAWGTYSQNTKDSIRNGIFNYKAAIKGLTKGGAKGRAKGGAITSNRYSKPIKCLETGEVFLNAYEVEYKLGIPRTNISNCCHGKREKAGGYHWEFIKKGNEN